MAETPQIKKGPADVMTPQLPQGEATKLNDQAAQFKQGQPEAAPDATPLQHNPPAPLGKDPTSQFLHGPTDRPNEPLSTGIAQDGTLKLGPGQAAEWLSNLSTLSQDPNAPPSVKAFLALLAQTARSQ